MGHSRSARTFSGSMLTAPSATTNQRKVENEICISQPKHIVDSEEDIEALDRHVSGGLQDPGKR